MANKNASKKADRIFNKDRIRRIKEAAEQSKQNDPNWLDDAPPSVFQEEEEDLSVSRIRTPSFLKNENPDDDTYTTKKLTLNELTQCNKDSSQVLNIISGAGKNRQHQEHPETPQNHLEQSRQRKLTEREFQNRQMAETIDKASEKWHHQLKEFGKSKSIQDSTGVKTSLFDEEMQEREKFEKESSEKSLGSRKNTTDFATRLDFLLQRGLRNPLSKSMTNLRSVNEKSFGRWNSRFDSLSSISDLKYSLLNSRTSLGIHSNHFTPSVKPVGDIFNKRETKPYSNNRSNRFNNLDTNMYAQTVNNFRPFLNSLSPVLQNPNIPFGSQSQIYQQLCPQNYPQFPISNNSNSYIPMNTNASMIPNSQNHSNIQNYIAQTLPPNINSNNYAPTPNYTNHPNLHILNNPHMNDCQQYPIGNNMQYNSNPVAYCQSNIHNSNIPNGNCIQNGGLYNSNEIPVNYSTVTQSTQNVDLNNTFETVSSRINDLADKLDKLNATVDKLSWNQTIIPVKSIMKASRPTTVATDYESSPSFSNNSDTSQSYSNSYQSKSDRRTCNCADCNFNNSDVIKSYEKKVHFNNSNEVEKSYPERVSDDTELEVQKNNEMCDYSQIKSHHPMSIQKRYNDNNRLSMGFSKFELPSEATSLLVSNCKRSSQN